MKQVPSKRRLRSVLVAGVTLLAGWLAYRSKQPRIDQVLADPSTGMLTVLGRRFGRRQEASVVVVRAAGQRIRVREVVSWTDREIVLALPKPRASGTVQVLKRTSQAQWESTAAPFVLRSIPHPTRPYGYQVPVQADAPWPTFRRDHRNTGRSTLPAQYHGDHPWTFRTGKGIFSTPIIDGQGTIYVGSADHKFYALCPDGSEKWHLETGEIIDSAGALLEDAAGEGAALVPSGDGLLYCLRTGDGSPLWTFDARTSPRASYNNWWEANVAVGFDGTIYAGNTNFNYYALHPDGRLKWTYPAGANCWSAAALADDGTIFWASLDAKIRAVLPDGREKWSRRTLGFVAASAAVGTDGTVYIGSFDSYLYALNPVNGRVKWKFKTGDHIYCSAALGEDEQGQTGAIYFGSTDGFFYALSPQGKLLWRYDTGAPIRSSPALGRAPEGEEGDVVYFGCGNGRLYALNAADGSRRWSFDLTPADPELRDRNDLNGSPALGTRGIYIGGEHGYLSYVPYDYPLHAGEAEPAAGMEDAAKRGCTDPGEDLSDDVKGMFYVTPGGNTLLAEELPALPAAAIVTLRLLVREGGETVDAHLCNAPWGCPDRVLQVSVQPEFPFHWQQSADGRYLHLFPEGFLQPDTTYQVRVQGAYYGSGPHLGNLTLGGRQLGRFDGTVTLRTEAARQAGVPFTVGQDEVTALEWTRLAVPIPRMLPSLNQIGFDYMDWILGTAAVAAPDAAGQRRVILWAIGGRRDERGVLVADPDSDFTLPLSGTCRDGAFILSNHSFTLAVTGIPIPFNVFQLRGRLGPDLRVTSGATAYAEARVLGIPTFGPYLVVAGLANKGWQNLLALGTYVTRPYDPAGPANRRPEGVAVEGLDYVPPARRSDGRVVARFRLQPGVSCPLSRHRPGILLLDAAQVEAVPLDYHAHLAAEAGGAGDLASVTLRIPAGTALPPALEAVVLLDVFPLFRQRLDS